ncbi:MAG: hypothetical protein LBQ58_10655 [Synergistaceae bacterium]|nr:hypothetical protein [Synergistaceae bacterium]
MHIVTVTVSAPAGHKPRKIQIKGVVVSRKASYKSEAERRILEEIKSSFKRFEEIGLKFQVSSATTSVSLITTDVDEEVAGGVVVNPGAGVAGNLSSEQPS